MGLLVYIERPVKQIHKIHVAGILTVIATLPRLKGSRFHTRTPSVLRNMTCFRCDTIAFNAALTLDIRCLRRALRRERCIDDQICLHLGKFVAERRRHSWCRLGGRPGREWTTGSCSRLRSIRSEYLIKVGICDGIPLAPSLPGLNPFPLAPMGLIVFEKHQRFGE